MTKLKALRLCVPAAVCMNRCHWETGQTGIRKQNLYFRYCFRQWTSAFLAFCIWDWNISYTISLNIVVKVSHLLQGTWQTEYRVHCVGKPLADSDSRGRLPRGIIFLGFWGPAEFPVSSQQVSCNWHFTGTSLPPVWGPLLKSITVLVLTSLNF